jgi:hypothetical protein
MLGWSIFSPAKNKPKAQEEVITITLPLKWSEQGLKDKIELIFQAPEIPVDRKGQIKCACLFSKMAYTAGKRQTLVKAMNGTNSLADDYKSLPQVCFHTNESENYTRTNNETKPLKYEQPPVASTVHHTFEKEPELPTGHSVYITCYDKKVSELLLKKWVDEYADGVPFHRLKFKTLKTALDRAFGGPQNPLRFDLWDYITNLYLYRNGSKLMEDEEAYVQGQLDGITTRHGNGNKIKTNVRSSPTKQARNQR